MQVSVYRFLKAFSLVPEIAKYFKLSQQIAF